MSLLSKINGPADLKRLKREQLPQLAQEIRDRLIECVSMTGGHIGASLGVVELSIALLYEFDSPRDQIVWDVGHQAYAWKLLTGRNDPFPTLRQRDGISGFLSEPRASTIISAPATPARRCRPRSAWPPRAISRASITRSWRSSATARSPAGSRTRG